MASAYKVILSTTEVVSWPAILERASQHEQGKGNVDLHKGDDMIEEVVVTDTLTLLLTGICTH